MKTNRLTEKITAALNQQITNEAHASQIYLAYASWADNQGYSGIAKFLFRHAQEERNHMMKLLEYILIRGAKVKISTIPAPGPNPADINNCFEKVFQQEVINTNAIYKLVKMSLDAEDWATFNFLQYFVKEQTEEETLAISILDKLKISGGAKAGSDVLYVLDKDLGNATGDMKSAEDATAENP